MTELKAIEGIFASKMIFLIILPLSTAIWIMCGNLGRLLARDMTDDLDSQSPEIINDIACLNNEVYILGPIVLILVFIIGTFILLLRGIAKPRKLFRKVLQIRKELIKEKRKNRGWDE